MSNHYTGGVTRHASEDDPASAGRPTATPEEAAALLSAPRIRILRICYWQPRTNRQIADLLGRDPATTLHHIRRLVQTGFLKPQPPRRGARGALEIPYLATGKTWKIAIPGQDRALLAAFLEEISLLPSGKVETTRLGLRLERARVDEFRQRIYALFEEYADDPPDPAGETWSLFFAIHRDPNADIDA